MGPNPFTMGRRQYLDALNELWESKRLQERLSDETGAPITLPAGTRLIPILRSETPPFDPETFDPVTDQPVMKKDRPGWGRR